MTDNMTNDSMTNDKPTMKVYTEEKLREAIQMADKHHYLLASEESEIIESLNPIELPSDEEIWDKADEEESLSGHYAVMRGAQWMRDKIKECNK